MSNPRQKPVTVRIVSTERQLHPRKLRRFLKRHPDAVVVGKEAA